MEDDDHHSTWYELEEKRKKENTKYGKKGKADTFQKKKISETKVSP